MTWIRTDCGTYMLNAVITGKNWFLTFSEGAAYVTVRIYRDPLRENISRRVRKLCKDAGLIIRIKPLCEILEVSRPFPPLFRGLHRAFEFEVLLMKPIPEDCTDVYEALVSDLPVGEIELQIRD